MQPIVICEGSKFSISHNVLVNVIADMIQSLEVRFWFLQAVDGYIGDIMAAFDKAGIYNETLFILTADHGG